MAKSGPTRKLPSRRGKRILDSRVNEELGLTSTNTTSNGSDNPGSSKRRLLKPGISVDGGPIPENADYIFDDDDDVEDADQLHERIASKRFSDRMDHIQN